MSKKYLIITPESYIGSIQALINQKEQRGYDVRVKRVEDFSDPVHGEIRTYVTRNLPDYLLLVGDNEIMPGYPLQYTHEVNGETITKEYISDNYLAMRRIDIYPKVAVGRLSTNAINQFEEQRQLAKICDLLVSYPQTLDPKWRRTVILTGWLPRPRESSGYDSGRECLKEIGNYFDTEFRFEHKYTDSKEAKNDWRAWNSTKDSLITGINRGALIIRYNGHGSAVAWANIGVENHVIDEEFKTSDVNRLNVGDFIPLVISNACLTGQVDISPSLAEALQTECRAIGVFAADEPTLIYWSDRFGPLFFRALIKTRNTRVGDAILEAMKNVYEDYCQHLRGEVRTDALNCFKQYRYYGDPDTILPLHPLVERIGDSGDQAGVIREIKTSQASPDKLISTVRTNNDKLTLIGWNVEQSGALTRISDSGNLAGRINPHLDVTPNMPAVVACKTSTNKLKLIFWGMNIAGNIRRITDSGNQAGEVKKAKIAQLSTNHYVTAVITREQKLKLIVWGFNSSTENLSRLNDSSSTGKDIPVKDISITKTAQYSDGYRVATASIRDNNGLRVDWWKIKYSGEITHLGDFLSGGGDISQVRSVKTRGRYLIISFSDEVGRLRLISCEIAANNRQRHLTRCFDSGYQAGKVKDLSLISRDYGVLTSVRTNTSRLTLIKWSVLDNGEIVRTGDSGKEAGKVTLLSALSFAQNNKVKVCTAIKSIIDSKLKIISWDDAAE